MWHTEHAGTARSKPHSGSRPQVAWDPARGCRNECVEDAGADLPLSVLLESVPAAAHISRYDTPRDS